MNKPLSITGGLVLGGLLFCQPAMALTAQPAAEPPAAASHSTGATGTVIAKKAKGKADKKAGKADAGEAKGDSGKKSSFPSKAESLKDIDDISKK
jgi:hypothetical protein